MGTYKTGRLEVGQRIGMVVIDGEAGRDATGRRRLRYVCDCGNKGEAHETNLKRETALPKSCGCTKVKHGLWRDNPAEYESWSSMMKRCHSPKSNGYDRYGARGIVVCQEWHDFAVFLRDMGARPAGSSIERVNNDGNYEPGNCRWATTREQSLNRSSNRIVEIDGIRKPLQAWCDEFGVSYRRVHGRLSIGWDIKNALTRPRVSGNPGQKHAVVTDVRGRQGASAVR